jgi:hypothetical protein
MNNQPVKTNKIPPHTIIMSRECLPTVSGKEAYETIVAASWCCLTQRYGQQLWKLISHPGPAESKARYLQKTDQDNAFKRYLGSSEEKEHFKNGYRQIRENEVAISNTGKAVLTTSIVNNCIIIVLKDPKKGKTALIHFPISNIDSFQKNIEKVLKRFKKKRPLEINIKIIQSTTTNPYISFLKEAGYNLAISIPCASSLACAGYTHAAFATLIACTLPTTSISCPYNPELGAQERNEVIKYFHHHHPSYNVTVINPVSFAYRIQQKEKTLYLGYSLSKPNTTTIKTDKKEKGLTNDDKKTLMDTENHELPHHNQFTGDWTVWNVEKPRHVKKR